MTVLAKFLNELHTTTAPDEKGEALDSDLVYSSPIYGGLITVPAGFVTDGASVPRLPFAYMLFGGTAKHAAVIHDWLYRTAAVPRSQADAIFREAMQASGIGWFHRSTMWAGVRLFGGFSYLDKISPPDDDTKGSAP